METSCDRYVQGKIPSFESIWDEVSVNDKWSNIVDEEYYSICESKGIDCNEGDAESLEEAEDIVKATAKKMYDDVVDFIIEKFKGNDRMTIFRAIMVANVDEFIDRLERTGKSLHEGVERGVGVYWSWDLKHAKPYWHEKYRGERDQEIVIEATVHCNVIDFNDTIKAYLLFSEGFEEDLEALNENEIRLKIWAKIDMKAYHVNGKRVEMEREIQAD